MTAISISNASHDAASKQCWVMRLPLRPLNFGQTIAATDELVKAGQPSYFITANLNHAMLTAQYEDLAPINREAAFIVADGITLVWTSRLLGHPVPERVTGADLIYGICEMAADRGYRVFFLGGGPGIALEAADRLVRSYPGLRVVGAESPRIEPDAADGASALLDRIRTAAPDILFVALGSPKGDRWIYQHYRELKVPVSVQVGAAFDFVSGRVPRAPRWMQSLALETPYRIYREPVRLTPRYARNLLFLSWCAMRCGLRRLSTRLRFPRIERMANWNF
jgi:N-acetylglucosaminyldiphosphoundecaprenol N-acetyl-beta-D-mannosaminyltransferase